LPSADAAEVGSADGTTPSGPSSAPSSNPRRAEHFHKEPHREREYGDDKQRQMRLSLKSEFSESEFSHDQLGIV
jgi:hypothetical protein